MHFENLNKKVVKRDEFFFREDKINQRMDNKNVQKDV